MPVDFPPERILPIPAGCPLIPRSEPRSCWLFVRFHYINHRLRQRYALVPKPVKLDLNPFGRRLGFIFPDYLIGMFPTTGCLVDRANETERGSINPGDNPGLTVKKQRVVA